MWHGAVIDRLSVRMGRRLTGGMAGGMRRLGGAGDGQAPSGKREMERAANTLHILTTTPVATGTGTAVEVYDDDLSDHVGVIDVELRVTAFGRPGEVAVCIAHAMARLNAWSGCRGVAPRDESGGQHECHLTSTWSWT